MVFSQPTPAPPTNFKTNIKLNTSYHIPTCNYKQVLFPFYQNNLFNLLTLLKYFKEND